MPLLAILLIIVATVGSEPLDCIMSDPLTNDWSVRGGNCVHGQLDDGHLHFQSSHGRDDRAIISWTSMRSGLHVPAGGNVTMDLKCSSFSFVPGNPEFLFADRTRSIGLISFEATALAFKAGRAVTMEPTYVVPAAG